MPLTEGAVPTTPPPGSSETGEADGPPGPAPPGPAPPGPAPPAPRRVLLEFSGSAAEYFRIWAVNLFLTLATLGVFSAWAKVRKKRYLYAHTRLGGTPFQYLAQPLPILRGRLVAAAVFLAYWLGGWFMAALPWVLGIGVAIAPWVIVRSAAFQARYTAWRGLTLRFTGTYRGALGPFWRTPVVPAFLAISLLPAFLGASFEEQGKAMGGALLVLGVGLPFWQRNLRCFVVSHTSFGGETARFGATGRQFFGAYFRAGLLMLIGAALTGIAFAFAGGAMSRGWSGWAPLAFAPAYAAYVLSFGVLQARVGNLVWNHVRLGPLRFRSTLRAFHLGGIYLTNVLAMLASAGLLTPWAVIRTMRYRASCLEVSMAGDWDRFEGTGAGAVRAAGAEMGEMFELDFSI